VAAQFSIQYSLACALARRRLGVADIRREAVLDPEIAVLAGKVRSAADASNQGKFAPARIAVTTARHGRVERDAPFVPGAPEHPLSAEEHRAKVLDCLAVGPRPLEGDTAALLIDRIGNIERVADMRRLFDGIGENSKEQA
jgi:2-methylcitrate dehydratase PrpD